MGVQSDGARIAEVLQSWGNAEVVRRLVGGVRNDVWLIDLNGGRYVARTGRRSVADLDWEVDLLEALDLGGLRVPKVVPSSDGRRHVDGVMVMEFVDGRPPASKEDWAAVGDYLRRVHAVGSGRPQRPGWASSIDLLVRAHGTSIDLDAMPAEAVERCRVAWRRMEGLPLTVVHGDPNPGNVRVNEQGVVLLDWDEARVDVPQLDLAALPAGCSGLEVADLWAAKQAASAWEAAVCWTAEPDYAKGRLAEVEVAE